MDSELATFGGIPAKGDDSVRRTLRSAQACKRPSRRPRVLSITGVGKHCRDRAAQLVRGDALAPTIDRRFNQDGSPDPLQPLGVAQALGKGRDDDARLARPEARLTCAIPTTMG